MSFARSLSLLLLVMSARALSGEASTESPVDYVREIKPVLQARCYACHGALEQQGKLRLDTVAFMREGGKSGSVLHATENLLLDRVTHPAEDERMPQEGAALTSAQITKLRAWILAGAPGPADEQPEADPRTHWAFQQPRRASAPRDVPHQRTENPIDQLIQARHSQGGLKPQGEASRDLWLRRVSLDLTGLPPAPEELRAFVADTVPDAHERAVDRLLASPRFGERWARHFMDLWRYSDWWGLDQQLRHSQKHIWQWRDWIVESLNSGKGYDRMIVEMLAADELAPEDAAALRATGFLCRSYYLFNRTTWLDEVVEHTSRAFLGLTLQCAKCHDHKYDPLKQTDYYRMRAIFEPYHVRLDAAPGEPDFEKGGLPRAFDLHLDRPTYLQVRGDEKQPDKSRVIPPGPPVLFGELAITPVTLPLAAHAPGSRPHVRENLERAAAKAVVAAREAAAAAKDDGERGVAGKQLRAAEAELRALQARAAADAARRRGSEVEPLAREAAKAEAEASVARADAELLVAEQQLEKLRGAEKPDQAAIAKGEKTRDERRTKLEQKQKEVAAAGTKYTPLPGSQMALTGPDDSLAKHAATYPPTSTGRRLALARWIASPANPLTARVAVNHLWTRVFGQSLVADVSDFGRRCAPPLHQDILDTLAVELVEHDWSLKHVLRLMTTSRLYRTSSSNAGADTATIATDADNVSYWRMNPKRLDAQALRDSVLHVAGLLDFTTGGPPIEPKDESSRRRALYFRQTADTESKFLGVFDNANVLECYQRRESVTPQQALALANSKLSGDSAETLAKKLSAMGDARFNDELVFIKAAFFAVLARDSRLGEEETSRAALGTLRSAGPRDELRARTLFVQALLNHNDFVTVR